MNRAKLRFDALKKVLITGAEGFIGKNLTAHLSRIKNVEILAFTRKNSQSQLIEYVRESDFIFHLAGVNRDEDEKAFQSSNEHLTETIIQTLDQHFKDLEQAPPIVFSSSTKAVESTIYGQSKLAAEEKVLDLAKKGFSAAILRLPNVFGKWSRPNYNSFVATFCWQLANNKEIQINDKEHKVQLIYIDDLVNYFVSLLTEAKPSDLCGFLNLSHLIYSSTVGEVAEQLIDIQRTRQQNYLPKSGAGEGLARALYATFLSFLPKSDFVSRLNKKSDQRGDFIEFLKHSSFGQISVFTIEIGESRGGHFHHTKTERFLILAGTAKFIFDEILTGEQLQFEVDGSNPMVVETIPGWSHKIVNTGTTKVVSAIWANEIFDPDKPDTFNRCGRS